MTAALRRPLGALPSAHGRFGFRVWAPAASALAVRIHGEEHPLVETDGVFEGELPARPGDEYLLVLDGEKTLPDPCSRAQPEGVRGPSRLVDPEAFEWSDEGWQPPTLSQLVIYELHVGTFSEVGTFDGVLPHLERLRELGVTAIELMPVATFPGERGWGYDGLYAYAPHPAYGGPEGLARLVDAAHARGLAVILDVVYNHLGPGSEAVSAFGPYFSDRHETFWGAAMNYDGEGSEGVREWAIQNACMWARDYHVDGLRLDAVHAIADDGPAHGRGPHVLAELRERVRETNPRALVISEMEVGDLRPIREWGHDAQWEDSLHHALHVLLTGEREGYYERYGRVSDLAAALAHPDAPRFVVCAQNHDQVGNRALGDRLRGAKLRLAAFCTLLSPGVPLVFMGEEHDERQPFQFFADHIDPVIAEATREGRRREFADFASFAGGEIPDPQAGETFLRSKLDRARSDSEQETYYRQLLVLRRELTAWTDAADASVDFDEERRWLRVRRGPVTLVANFSDEQLREPADVPPWSGVVMR